MRPSDLDYFVDCHNYVPADMAAPDYDRLFVAFAGGPQNVYQFGNFFRKMGFNYILFKDSTQQYHQNGVKGIGNRDDVIDYLRNWRASRKLIFTGVSSGSYAALLYGQLVPADEIIVFSPLSGRDVDDFPAEWHSRIYDPNINLDDLRKYFPNGPNARVQAYIGDDYETCFCDHIMCGRIGVRNIQIVPNSVHGEVARNLRDRSLLELIFSNAGRGIDVEPLEKLEIISRGQRIADDVAYNTRLERIKDGRRPNDELPLQSQSNQPE